MTDQQLPEPDRIASARSLPVRDMVERDGESVVLLDGQVLHLSEMATFARECCVDWMDFPELVDRLVAEFGVPEDGDEDATRLVLGVLTSLSGSGLVELRGASEDPVAGRES